VAVKRADLSDTGSCPLCDADLVLDSRMKVGQYWMISRTYACGCTLGGFIGSKLSVDRECSPKFHLKCPRAA
jgi:hypothetical protein